MNTAFKIVPLQGFDVCLWLHTATDPSGQEWTAACAECKKLVERLKGDTSRVRSLVFSDGGAPSAAQRVQLFRDIFNGKLQIAVVTNSLTNPIKRGIATALFWINPAFRVFEPRDINAALAHIDLPPDFAELYAQYSELQSRLPPVESLRIAQTVAKFQPARATL